MSKQFVNNVSSVAILATCWHEVPMPPLEGEVGRLLPQQCFVLSFLSTSVTFIYYHLQGFLPSQRRRLRWYYGFI